MVSRVRVRSASLTVFASLAVGLLATPAVAASRGGIIHVIVNFRGPRAITTTQQLLNKP